MHVISSRISTVIIQVVRTIIIMLIVLILKYNSKLIYKLKYFLGPKIRSTNLNGQNEWTENVRLGLRFSKCDSAKLLYYITNLNTCGGGGVN